jgi:outer membrane protein OmpA-like peptidoglycan-associated protein
MTLSSLRYTLAAGLMLAFGLTTTTGCSNTGRGAAIGAGTGAVVGGVIGRATGSTARGAIIGAAVGGTAGAVIGRQMDKQAEELDDDLENADVTPIPGEDGETAGIAIRFDNALLFDLGQATLRPGVQADLRDLASSLRNYPDHDAVVVGHASTDGPTDFNQSLSERRARAVEDFLVGQGVSAYRLEAYGRGESEPLAGIPGDSPQNRRVEIAIYPNEQYRQNVQSQYN